ncbi:hypothetical protein CDAR_275281 [Caerostris darwini]|uniref:Uncharacterized protein n=1 Tax=Caerostris darwini TaxID=1538125 RepID=A0AAV4MNN2_9ARAC|nr:hypothetical protein CDAR_275281 [Caerostris darwini]
MTKCNVFLKITFQLHSKVVTSHSNRGLLLSKLFAPLLPFLLLATIFALPIPSPNPSPLFSSLSPRSRSQRLGALPRKLLFSSRQLLFLCANSFHPISNRTKSAAAQKGLKVRYSAKYCHLLNNFNKALL